MKRTVTVIAVLIAGFALAGGTASAGESASRLVGARATDGPEDPQTYSGTVRWFNKEKGIGFIAPDSGPGEVVLVAKSAYAGIKKNDRVSFQVQVGDQVSQATNVKHAD